MEKVTKIIQNQELGQVFLNEEMKYHTTMRTGGKVAVLFIPDSMESLITVVRYLILVNIDYKIMGRGSNVIFGDEFHDIFVIKLSKCLEDLTESNESIVVGSGFSTMKLAKMLSKKGIPGFEFAGGIPGAIGGAIFMNAGAHTSDFSQLVESVTTITNDGAIKVYNNQECKFGYRSSIFQENKEVIISVTFIKKTEDPASIYKRMLGNLAYRKDMQPLTEPSCGSTFVNPQGHHAGQLIEECGLKGYVVGGAQVSTKHANFVINSGDATTCDIIKLIELIKYKVKKETGIQLETEIEFIGIKVWKETNSYGMRQKKLI